MVRPSLQCRIRSETHGQCGELYEQILVVSGDVEEAEAASIIMMRSQLDGLVGEVLADNCRYFANG